MFNVFRIEDRILIVRDDILYTDRYKKYIKVKDIELLFRLDWEAYIPGIKRELREYEDLRYIGELPEEDRLMFEGIYRNLPQVIQFFNDNKFKIKPDFETYRNSRLTESEKQETLMKYWLALDELKKLGVVKDQNYTTLKNLDWKAKDVIKYLPDIPNYVSILFGEREMNLATDWIDLEWNQKNLIKDFYSQPTRESKLEFMREKILKSGEPETYYEFLPEWFKVNVHVFGLEKIRESERGEEIEWNKKETLNHEEQTKEKEKEEIVKKEIYARIPLGVTMTGDNIKFILSDIYEAYSYQPNKNYPSKLGNLGEYFEIKKVRGGYKFITRKII